jgi:hypothetical protein
VESQPLRYENVKVITIVHLMKDASPLLKIEKSVFRATNKRKELTQTLVEI